MFILYFESIHFEYHHAKIYAGWTDYPSFRPGEGFWLVPGTDPEDDAYGRDIQELDEDENEGDQNDETLEYMCDLLEAGEIEPSEFRRQLLSVGYSEETISLAPSNGGCACTSMDRSHCQEAVCGFANFSGDRT